MSDLSINVRRQSAASRAGAFEHAILSLRQLPPTALYALARQRGVSTTRHLPLDDVVSELAAMGVVVA